MFAFPSVSVSFLQDNLTSAALQGEAAQTLDLRDDAPALDVKLIAGTRTKTQIVTYIYDVVESVHDMGALMAACSWNPCTCPGIYLPGR